MPAPFNVLFLCTANSARSILAEAILSRGGAGRFRAFSAGSQPKGEVHPLAIAHLSSLGYDTGFARSKSWDDFAGDGVPVLDFIFTVCDSAAAEACPVWPGHPATAHWGVPDPAAVEGSVAVRRAAFARTYCMLEQRISTFVDLPIHALDDTEIRAQLAAIGVRDDHLEPLR